MSSKRKGRRGGSHSRKGDDDEEGGSSKRSRSSRGKRTDDTTTDDQTDDDTANVVGSIFMSFLPQVPPPVDDDRADDPGCCKPKSKIAQIREKILKLDMDPRDKEGVLARLRVSDGDKTKHLEWFEHLVRIPFGKKSKLPIALSDRKEQHQNYFDKVECILNESVYGMDSVKEEVLNYIAQFISMGDDAVPRVIGLCGDPGTGKTSIIRKGLSQSLNRPMRAFSCGGMKDSSYLLGFDHCYSGSRYGAIVQSLIELQTMNPILFFDELDKISMNSDGLEIANLLIHITDPSQNYDFADKYFSGIHIDLSKAVIVFSYNDSNLINPVLKDRIYEIKVPTPTEDEKVIIGVKYLLKELCAKIGFKEGEIVCSDEVMRQLIRDKCKKDKGVRGLKNHLETVLMKINTARYIRQTKYKCLKEVTLPFTLTTEIIKGLLANTKSPDDEMLSYPSMYI